MSYFPAVMLAYKDIAVKRWSFINHIRNAHLMMIVTLKSLLILQEDRLGTAITVDRFYDY